jgi:S-adenosylmethionine-diacylglycerol 3-amino-3-carboxypropyl transferase
MQFDAALNKVKDKMFSRIHLNNLVYNTCWEDPRIDRQLMNINSESKILMITSAGCNALDYLLDNPNHIYCVDVNPRQNALLELKKAAIKKLLYSDFFQLFGEGFHTEYKGIYQTILRPLLPEYAREFWDKKIKYFSPKNYKGSFYFRGTSGQFAWLFKKYLDANKDARKAAYEILEARNEEEQKEIFKQLEPSIMSRFVKWMMNRHFTMSLLGVPRAQRDLITNYYPGGMAGYLTDNLRHIFTELPIHDNYFWRLYITGKYTKNCCPNYLRKENFYHLKLNIDKLTTSTTTVTKFLKDNNKQITHFVLLDHQDWLAKHDEKALYDEWEEIFKNADLGAKILMRSAANEIDYLPNFVGNQVKFDQKLAMNFHLQDRVGTYGSTYFGKIAMNINSMGAKDSEGSELALN